MLMWNFKEGCWKRKFRRFSESKLSSEAIISFLFILFFTCHTTETATRHCFNHLTNQETPHHTTSIVHQSPHKHHTTPIVHQSPLPHLLPPKKHQSWSCLMLLVHSLLLLWLRLSLIQHSINILKKDFPVLNAQAKLVGLPRSL